MHENIRVLPLRPPLPNPKISKNFPKMLYSIPKFLFLHFGENFTKIQTKIAKFKMHEKVYFHLCPRMDFLQTLHINNSLYTIYENVFIELDS